jgi:hypothetical protein
VSIDRNGRHTKVAAHRLAFKVVHGHWPEPMGLHTCDNPPCFNPRHIYEGTDRDNKNDQIARGRTTQGVAQRDAKLTDELVAEARQEYAKGKIGFTLLGRKYGVTAHCMKMAVTGKNWKHVPNPVLPIVKKPILRDTCCRGHLLTPDNIYCYVNGHLSGPRRCKQCARMYGKARKDRARGR